MQPPGPQPLAFRPPVHRRQDRGHHGKRSPRVTQRKTLRTYADVALHVLGDDVSDVTSQRSSVSPSNSLQFSQRFNDGRASANSTLSRDSHSLAPGTSQTADQTQETSVKSLPTHDKPSLYLRPNLDPALCREEADEVSSPPAKAIQESSLKKGRKKQESIFEMEGEIHESCVYEPPPPLREKCKNKARKKSNSSIAQSQQPQSNSSDEINPERNFHKRHCVTLTGTMKRGKKQDLVNVMLTPSEMAVLNKATSREKKQKEKRSKCGCRMGPHVLVWSILFIPFAFISSLFISFYTGSMCWYNLYIFLSEECSVVHRIFLCPLLIIFYPVLIVITAFAIAFYSMFVQISWFCTSWCREIKNPDKNFYGWVCNKLHVPHCAPYEIVIIEETNPESIECLDGDESN